ncbi:MAG: hypothetical protein JNJ56_04095 [Ignavibacteria bacterium]|nr:hypothetical protein [Ignavibacteria bacterium]
MKTKIYYFAVIITLLWLANSGFSPTDDSPKWNTDPRTRVNLNPEGVYTSLPAGDNKNFSNEVRYVSTPQGVFAVGPNFRVHPTTARTQSETPIIRHPTNSNIMFASANTYNVGGTTSFSTACYKTTDGGVTWSGSDTTVFNFGDPAPMIMHTGRFLISYITSTGAMGAAYSTDLGTTWSGTVTFPGSTTSSDKNLSAVDGIPTSSYYGRCYTVYTEFSGAYTNRIVSSYSNDGGVTWSSVIPVSPPPSPGHHHQGCDVTVDIYGWVRVVWANCTTNGQNSTEDSLGWAESGTGGTSWADASNHKVNMNGIRSSDFLTPSNVAIRMNGFPRIDGDKTCNSSADDEYVVAAEKDSVPALDKGDIILMKTPDGGGTWTRTRVNQNAAGSYEFCPAVNVDATGAINVCYYSTRNVPTNDSAQIYLSRSTDGGATFTDVLVSDHKFKPVPISGLAAGYQGDYIGITSGGAGKILPYWCEQNTSTGGRYQAYSALVDVTQPQPCEDFSCSKDTGTSTTGVITRDFYEEYTGTNYWNRRSTASAYNIGAGSARFNSWSASAGTIQSLTSYNFTAVSGSSTYLTFDQAYASWSGGPSNIDSLIIESSANGGTSFTTLGRLYGGLNGNMNTALPGGQFTPTGGQWRPKIFLLPSGTNKVRFRARSAFGNDIWVDNLCVQTLSAPAATTMGLIIEGLFIPANPYNSYPDTVKLYAHRSDFPSVVVDSATSVLGANAVVSNLVFNRALTGDYWRVAGHRNSIDAWTNTDVAYTRGTAFSHFNFVQPDGQAYGNNQAIVSLSPLYHGLFSGDADGDGSIDASDLSITENAVAIGLSGYVQPDYTGDFYVDGSDLSIVENNQGVVEVAPPGAEPAPQPEYKNQTEEYKSDAERMKDEIGKRMFLEMQQKEKEMKEAKLKEKEELKKQYLLRSNNKPIDRPVEKTKTDKGDHGVTNVGY